MKLYKSDVAIIGGSFGAIAAAVALLEQGYRVTITEEYPWVGGQVTSQGLCVLDDLNVGERVGCSRRYSSFRDRVREYYKNNYQLSEYAKMHTHFCPGNARCSHLAGEPIAAHDAIMKWLEPFLQNGSLMIFTEYIPVEVNRQDKKIISFTCASTQEPQNQIQINADFFLDGTETGDTLPLLRVPFRIGSEPQSEFGEPHAPQVGNKSSIQSFTYCILVEFVPGGKFTIAKPDKYEYFKNTQNFYLSSAGATRQEPAYFLKPRIRKDGVRIVPFWNYRSVVDMINFLPGQNLFNRTVINVSSNDYQETSYLDHPQPKQVLQDARELSASYLYWLQTEVPRDDGGFGYPEIRPLPEVTGTADGIAQAPYVREGRRLRSLFTVTECHISVECQPNARAQFFSDSIGLGGYAIDIHHCPGETSEGVWQMARHYQIPLGSLVCSELNNFAVAGKALGVSHIANGAYRLHPEEWAIGEAAGSLAGFCLKNNIVHPGLTGQTLFNFQRFLIRSGVPVYWYNDMSHEYPGFEASQTLAISNVWAGSDKHLRFEPQSRLDDDKKSFEEAIKRIESSGLPMSEFAEPNLNSHGIRKYDLANALMLWLDYKGWHWKH